MKDARISPASGSGRPLRWTLATWFGVIVLLCSVAVGTLTYMLRSQGLQARIMRQLSQVRDDKILSVQHFFENRDRDIALWSKAPMVVEAASEHAAGQPVSQVEARRAELEQVREAYHCQAVALFDPQTGASFLTTQPSGEMQPPVARRFATQALAASGPTHTDVFVCPLHEVPTLIVAAAVRSPADRKEIAILAFHMDLVSWLYPQVLSTENLGETGEVMLVNQEGIAQSPLRHIQNAPGRSRVETEPVRRAIGGLTGTVHYTDYASHPVMAAYGFIPELRWGIVAKQDYDEVMSVVRDMGRDVIVVSLAALLLASVVSWFVARRIAAPTQGIAEVTERIRRGDLDTRIRPEGPREIQAIGTNFNVMMDQLAQQLRMGRPWATCSLPPALTIACSAGR